MAIRIAIYASMAIFPLVSLVFGIGFAVNIKRRKREDYGIISPRAFINHKVWGFANKLYSRLMFIAFPIITAGTLVAYFTLAGRDPNEKGFIAIMIIVTQVIILALLFLAVDIILLKRYDNDGKRRKKSKKNS
ncbi:MAG: hypothetical protein MJ080_05930 [Clostridia bacterium]|nr:hypothetical protein [Clostridia bacterium]